MGMGDPHINAMPQLEYVIKGALKKSSNRSGRPRLPITPAVLRAVRLVWEKDADRFNSSMLWAASCMYFFGFLRSGEAVAPTTRSFDPAVHVCSGDVRRDSGNPPRYLEVRLKASKTDTYSQGVSVYLGVTGVELCPVAAILNYMVRRGASPGPLFRF